LLEAAAAPILLSSDRQTVAKWFGYAKLFLRWGM
jgi:hypothetical protein